MESCLPNAGDKHEPISLDESLKLDHYHHAAHCCIYSPNSFSTVEGYESNAYISMQMRFDGCLGFPGGIVAGGSRQNIIDGLNRELVEEINLDKKYFVTKKDHYFTHVSREKSWCFHFFAKEVSVDDFLDIERQALNAEDYGSEVLGIIRVPLYIMHDKVKGFPTFLSNSFAGYAKHQLLKILICTKLMSQSDITDCLSKSQS